MKKNLKAIFTCLPSGVQGPQNCDFKALVYKIIDYIGMIIPIIFSLAVLYILWGIFQYIFMAQGDEKKIAESRRIMFYGIIGLFVMVSVWGIVKIIQGSLF